MQTKQGPEVKGAHRWQAKSCHQHTVVVEESSHLISHPQKQLAQQCSVGKHSSGDLVIIKDHWEHWQLKKERCMSRSGWFE